MEEHRTDEQGASRTRTVIGGLLAAGLALTATVALAARGPDGGDYGVGGYGADAGHGKKKGHRLHCPSYTGMYHSKGRATCHMAPRRAGVGAGEGTSQEELPSPTSSPSRVQSQSHGSPSAGSQSNGRRGGPGPAGQPATPNANGGRHGDDADTSGDLTSQREEPRRDKGNNGQKRGHGPKR
jgi:hypothetical protein